jgi:hypothetical protein
VCIADDVESRVVYALLGNTLLCLSSDLLPTQVRIDSRLPSRGDAHLKACPPVSTPNCRWISKARPPVGLLMNGSSSLAGVNPATLSAHIVGILHQKNPESRHSCVNSQLFPGLSISMLLNDWPWDH